MRDVETHPEERLGTVLLEIKEFVEMEFGSERHLTFVYGSRAYNLQKPDSDLDLMIIGDTVTKDRIERTVESVVGLFQEHGLSTDEEVPYERKLIATWSDVEAALAGCGFARKEDRLIASPVEKTTSFLCSEELRLRLILNALTGPTLLITGRAEHLSDLQKRARTNWLRILPLLLGFKDFSVSSFVTNLIGTDDCNGEWFLGFKDSPPIRAFLEEIFENTCRDAVMCGILKTSGDVYSFPDQQWLTEILPKAPFLDDGQLP
jgi:hypothetical protein